MATHSARSPEGFLELSGTSPPDRCTGRSVADMNRSWLGGAAAALVLALGPAVSAEASAANFNEAAGGGKGSSTAAVVSGNLIASVPGAAIAGDDHLPAILESGHTYNATFVIWVASNARHATLKVHADGGVVRYCSAAQLEPGLDRHLTCQIRAGRTQLTTQLTITVVVHTRNLAQYSHSYQHQLTP
jgi:hypothetical protein